MQLIIVSGPSGSGKTTISKEILKKIKDGIILNTDNYYKTGKISQILSKIIPSYFDRKISFNIKLFKNDFNFILKNGYSEFFYQYDFKNKSIIKHYKITKNIKFLIIEGIFGKEILKKNKKNKFILIELKTSKRICMKRVIKRDFMERNKSKDLAQRDFIKAWDLYHKNKSKKIKGNYLKKIIISKKTDLKLVIKKLFSNVS